jgi:SAM-dependent methyltransferase
MDCRCFRPDRRYARRLVKAYSYQERFALNAICPYFTMFPVEFPLKVLTKHPDARVVLDPFCGRGTTLFAARRRRVRGFGIDVSPVAIAISQAKLADVNTRRVVALAHELLERSPEPQVPTGRFWKLAFHRDTLRDICSLRASLLRMRKLDDDAVVLRAAVLGCLHGPLTSTNS